MRFDPPLEALVLAPGEAREIGIGLRPGRSFRPDDVRQEKHPAIDVRVSADGSIVGGMTYLLDPALKRPPIQRKGEQPVGLHHPAVEATMHTAAAELADEPEEDADADDGGRVPEADGSAHAVRVGAQALLSLLNLPPQTVQHVRLRRVNLEIDLAE
jgi:hypothetical protein